MPILAKVSTDVIHIIERLDAAGYEAYLVGGAVRDLLLDIQPKDYDIATSATPEEVKQVFRRRARIIGRRFRLVHVYVGGETYEISTFRREPDLEERKGRPDDNGLLVWRDNQWGTLEEDARRRDFTVNAIYFDPLHDEHRTIDFVGGMTDMEERRVRAIGDAETRMLEDPVRMLRACKLQGQYGFTLDPPVASAIRAHAAQLKLSSQARLLEELYKVLKKPFSLPTFEVAYDTGLLEFLLPEMSALWDTEAGRQSRELLGARDALLSAQTVYPSRVTGLAAMMLPAVAAALRAEGEDTPLWYNSSGIDRAIHAHIKEFFQPYQVPRSTTAKIRDVLLLQPKFLSGRARGRLINHPEYGRGRDLFKVVVKGLGLDPELATDWPPRRRRPRRRRHPRRKA